EVVHNCKNLLKVHVCEATPNNASGLTVRPRSPRDGPYSCLYLVQFPGPLRYDKRPSLAFVGPPDQLVGAGEHYLRQLLMARPRLSAVRSGGSANCRPPTRCLSASKADL